MGKKLIIVATTIDFSAMEFAERPADNFDAKNKCESLWSLSLDDKRNLKIFLSNFNETLVPIPTSCNVYLFYE